MSLARCALALLLALAPVQAWACSPPPQREAAGFARADIGHLPRNARGVMFYPAARPPRPRDVQLTSDEDKRPLSVRVRTFKGMTWVRLEPVHGFQPGARYRFRYLARHGAWANPDEMRVTIDAAAVSTAGSYAFDVEAAPAYKVVLVPTSSGSCVEPAPMIVQAFTYRIPAALLPYRDVVRYSAGIATAARPGAPVLYDTGAHSVGLGFSTRYTARDNAVIAACGTRPTRVRLAGTVGFPELDMVDNPVPAVDLDLGRNVAGRCEPLDALLRSVDWRAPEPALREVCRAAIAGSFAIAGLPLRAVEAGEWQRELEYFSAMSVTCNLAALAHLWHTNQAAVQPGTLHDIGAALATGWHGAAPAERDAAVHALAYLTDQLPPATRAAASRQLLAPLRAALAEAAAAPHPAWPGELAQLTALAGAQPPAR